MKTYFFSHFAPRALLVILGLAGAGCSSDSNATPPVTIHPLPEAGTGGSGQGGGGAGNAGGGGTGNTGGAGTGGSAGNGGSSVHPLDGGSQDGGDGGQVIPPCATQTGTNGCISACPKTIPDYLNQCTALGVCQSFDNATRLGATLWNNGNLVPLN